MPHIGVMMERSLQDRSWGTAFGDLLSRSAMAALGKRQSLDGIGDSINDAKTAFSSWDNCFKSNICKWPVIALFIIGGLILFSIVWCIIRCCCCGLSCCCECCLCLKCCGQCCGMCDPPRGSRRKYLDEPFVPPNQDQAYRSQAPMYAGGFDAAKPSVPQYAEFDTGNKKDADALPEMPSWEGAGSKKVLIEEEYVEMEPLKKPIQSPSQMNLASTPAATTPGTMSTSPYDTPAGTGNPNGYMAAGSTNAGNYDMNQQGYNGYDNQGYGQEYSSNGMNNVAGVGGAMGRRAPPQDYNNGYDVNNNNSNNQGYSQYPQSRTPRPYNDELGRSGTPTSYENSNKYRGMAPNDTYGGERRSPAPQAAYGYGNPPRMGSPGAQAGYSYGNPRGSPAPQASYGYPEARRSPAPQAAFGNPNARASPAPQADYDYAAARRSPALQAGGYGYAANARASPAPQGDYRRPQRGYTQDDYTGRYPPAASQQRGYADDTYAYDNSSHGPSESYGQPQSPKSPIRNNSGFDFESGYTRSPRASPAPPQTAAKGNSAYPGYRSYKPAQTPQDGPQQYAWEGI
ncbi:hypothetical protein F4808DRAFT_222129 [Astrocystis sublimbata]|nr:hypothetical protein F4808DRAFT_222129 [Astrocystis sublimbata]